MTFCSKKVLILQHCGREEFGKDNHVFVYDNRKASIRCSFPIKDRFNLKGKRLHRQ